MSAQDSPSPSLAPRQEVSRKTQELIATLESFGWLNLIPDKYATQRKALEQVIELRFREVKEKEPSDGNALNLQMALEEIRDIPLRHLSGCNHCSLDDDSQPCSCGMNEVAHQIHAILEKCLSSHAPESSSGDTARLDWLERHPETLSHCTWVNSVRGRIFTMGCEFDPTVGDCHKTLRGAIDKALQDARTASDGVERDSPRQLPKSSVLTLTGD